MVDGDGSASASVAKAAEAAARDSYGKLIAFLSARSHDLAGAEDALSEAFAIALSEWPASGVPANPKAWLLTVARRKMIDSFRGRRRSEEVIETLLIGSEQEQQSEASDIPDDRLRLMFACAHPAIEAGVRAPLMLQAILGFDATTIASSFLASPAAISKRLFRAKAKIKQARIPFRLPDQEDMAERLETVLDAIYAIYAEGWLDPEGTDTARRNLSGEGLWLGRLISALLPEEPEALGLLSMMLYAEARRKSRRNALGQYVPLLEQDTSLWDSTLIDEAEALLASAALLSKVGRYQLEAAIQSAHTVRRATGASDWPAIERLYDSLFAMTKSPVVAINRAVAVAQTKGPEKGLALLSELASDKRLAEYQPYWAARAELLSQQGNFSAAILAYQQAIGLESDPAVRAFLQRRQSDVSVRTSALRV